MNEIIHPQSFVRDKIVIKTPGNAAPDARFFEKLAQGPGGDRFLFRGFPVIFIRDFEADQFGDARGFLVPGSRFFIHRP